MAGGILLGTTKRRSDDLIVSQILDICENGARKTRIIYQANLNSIAANRYLENLVEKGMVTKLEHGSNVVFKTTFKGIELRERLNRLHSEMDELRAT